MNTLGITLLWCALQVSVVGIVCLALRRCFRSAAPTITFAGLVVCCGLVVAALFPLPNWWELSHSMRRASAVVAPESTVSPSQDLSGQQATSASGQSTSNEQLDDAEVSTALWPEWLNWQALGDAVEVSAVPRNTSTVLWPAILASICLAMMAIGLLQLIAGMWSLAKVRRRSEVIQDSELSELLDILRAQMCVQKCPDLLECAELTTAATIGSYKPAILLPLAWREWSEVQRRAVLAHELAHIRRHDYLASLLAQVGVALQFYHPVMHWLASRLRLEQELAADALAAELVGGRQPYMYSLCELAIQHSDETLGWPARNFLPTRGALMRRIDMLRSSKDALPRQHKSARYTAVGVLLFIGIALVGLRGPAGSSLLSPVVAQETKPAPAGAADTVAEPVAGFDPALIPDDAVAIVSINAQALLANKSLQPVADLFTQRWKEFDLNSQDLEHVIFVVHPAALPRPGERQRGFPGAVILRAKSADLVKKLVQHEAPNAQKVVAGKYELFRDENAHGPFQAYVFLDERTVVLDQTASIASFLVNRSQQCKLLNDEAWKTASQSEIAVAIDSAWLRDMLEGELPGMMPKVPLSIVSPLWKDTDTLVASFSAGDASKLNIVASATNEEGAERVRATTEAVLTLARNGLQQAHSQLRQAPAEQQVVMTAGFKIVENVLKSAKVSREATKVSLDANVPLGEATMLGFIAPALSAQRIAAGRMVDSNHLKQIGLALHNFHDSYGHFPPPVLMGPDGKTPHSWRVAILPFIEGDALYRLYKFDEPWDSENNRRVLLDMPAVYRSPSNKNRQATNASYYALVGPEAIFVDNGKGATFAEITDGTSNTILIVEANRDIPWTKPEDIAVDLKKDLPKFGSQEEGFNALFADGSVKFIARNADARLLHNLITKAGGEVVQGLDRVGPTLKAVPVPTPTLRRP